MGAPAAASVLQAGASKLDAAHASAVDTTTGEYLRFLQQEEQPELILQACTYPKRMRRRDSTTSMP